MALRGQADTTNTPEIAPCNCGRQYTNPCQRFYFCQRSERFVSVFLHETSPALAERLNTCLVDINFNRTQGTQIPCVYEKIPANLVHTIIRKLVQSILVKICCTD